MSKYLIDASTLVSIGDAVREKDGTTAPIVVSDLATRIKAIPQEGGGGVELPAEALTITGDCDYRFAYNGWNWYMDAFGDKITTEDISSCSHTFYHFDMMNAINIPFDINVSDDAYQFGYMFSDCNYLQSAPIVNWKNITSQNSTEMKLNDLFAACYRLREIPYDFFNQDGATVWENKKNLQNSYYKMFYTCYSLRKHPDINCLRFKLTSSYGYSYSLYYNTFYKCYALDEIVNIPICDISKGTSNCFNGSFQQCERINRLTFETNEDGSPITATWSKQTIDLTSIVGYASKTSDITDYNSGIGLATRVTDAATYQALKDDEDWWTTDINYSRYNHDSAVETINSLPDVSAGSTNVIKFKGAAGALTDGGAINTLTEEEIAVATAKGWTVSLA